MRKKIFIITAFLTGVLLMTSCLKDKVGLYWPSSLSGKAYAEIWNGGFATFATAPSTDTVVNKFLINIASDQPLTEDVTLRLKVNPAAVLRYDSLNNADYSLFPYIKLIDSVIVIPAGSINAYCHVKIWNTDASHMDPCAHVMVPISIYSASGGVIVADANNMGSRLWGIQLSSNPYSGNYLVNGYRIRLGVDYPISNVEDNLTVVACNAVMSHQFGDYPYYVKITVTNTTMTVLGVTCNACIVDVINPADGSPLAAGYGQYTTFTGDPAEPPLPLSNDVNYYNPVTQTFVLNAYYNASGSTPRSMYEVLQRQ
ncbi:MAG TPA: DUF1735 domain-containing protein [Bacteroidales bacterium]|nr:DUF1735 domain-containing protein [Bacteroidales bacterium]